MAKFATLLIATVALLSGAQAACPANGQFCGSELIDVYQCKYLSLPFSLCPYRTSSSREISPVRGQILTDV